MFGNSGGVCNEKTVLRPVSPYGVSKLAAHHLSRVYRQRGLFVVSGILFNHESPRRGLEMVTRKITQHVARWCWGIKVPLRLGNIEARRDWGFAGDYVRAIHSMLQQDQPREYVVGMGQSKSVREFLLQALKEADIPYESVSGLITHDERFDRENEVVSLCADASNARGELLWEPEYDFAGLVRMMLRADIELIGQQLGQGQLRPTNGLGSREVAVA
jgi:GDPmannose 4,6-dehydratase